MTFCPCRIVSIIGSVNSGFCSCLAYSTWDSIYMGVWLLGFCSLGSLPIWQSVHKVIFPRYGLSNLVGLTFSSLPFWAFPTWCLSSWILSTLESGHMTVSPSRIVSTIGSVKSGLCSLLVLSTWESVHLGGCLHGISSLGSLATWQSVHKVLCPR